MSAPQARRASHTNSSNASKPANPSNGSPQSGQRSGGQSAGSGGGGRSSSSRRRGRSGGARSSTANPAQQKGQQRPNAAAPKADLFASFDTGPEPKLDATFAELGLPPELLRELTTQGIEAPFPIQAATLSDCLAGRDVLGRGRTGSGKTLAFVLPVLTVLAESRTQRRPGRPRALILVPTRELALQIQTAMEPYAHALSLRVTTIFGGVGPVPQIKALRAGVDVVVACPGRLLDHLNEGHATLDSIDITVLDEADHMADMGFLPDVKRILDRTPRNGQRLLFSATLDNGIDAIVRQYLTNPVLRSVDPVETTNENITHHVLEMRADDRFGVLRDLAAAPGRTIVFTRTKHGAKKLAKTLVGNGVATVEMQGNLSQNVRTRNLEAFREGTSSVMVATDIAARGIHVDDVALVVHFDPPVDHKAYLHRSGRTARAGAEGTVVTFMTADQRNEVNGLAKKAGISPTITKVDPTHPILTEIAPGERVFVDPATLVTRPATTAPATRPAARAAGSGRTDGQRPRPAGGRNRNANRSGGSRPNGPSDSRGRGTRSPR